MDLHGYMVLKFLIVYIYLFGCDWFHDGLDGVDDLYVFHGFHDVDGFHGRTSVLLIVSMVFLVVMNFDGFHGLYLNK